MPHLLATHLWPTISPCLVDITIRAKRGLKPFVVNIKIDLDQAIQDELFHKLGAKAIIKYASFGR